MINLVYKMKKYIYLSWDISIVFSTEFLGGFYRKKKIINSKKMSMFTTKSSCITQNSCFRNHQSSGNRTMFPLPW